MEVALSFLSVSELARLHFPGVPPKVISDLFYSRRLPDADAACPVVGGRRLVPASYIETIRLALARAGKLPSAEVSAHG